jgi:hypothetical protein
MRTRLLGPTTLLTTLLAFSATEAQDTKSKPPDNSAAAVDADTLKAGEYFGTLLNPPGRDGVFTLRIDRSRYEAKDSAQAARVNSQLSADLQRARALEQQVALNPTGQQLNRLQQAYDQVRRGLARQKDAYKVVADSKDVDFHAAGDMVVRFLLPPVVYDDKGELKKYRLIDLKEMRGVDPTVPGYEAKPSDLQTGQVVRVSLRPAKAKAAGTADPSKPAPKMEATMAVIVVAEDVSPVEKPRPAPKRGKKKAK